MQIGMIGLPWRGGRQCVVCDRYTDAVNILNKKGVTGVVLLVAIVVPMSKPCILWLKLPATEMDRGLGQLTGFSRCMANSDKGR